MGERYLMVVEERIQADKILCYLLCLTGIFLQKRSGIVRQDNKSGGAVCYIPYLSGLNFCKSCQLFNRGA